MVGKRAADVTRDQLKGALKRDFRTAAILATTPVPLDVDDYEVHHIVPVSLGGTNDYDNLALVYPFVHRQLHKYLSAQTVGMEKGDSRNLIVPYYQGKVWGPLFSQPT
jgi:5-methylcytosine-specific restriction endonuclease McrA